MRKDELTRCARCGALKLNYCTSDRFPRNSYEWEVVFLVQRAKFYSENDICTKYHNKNNSWCSTLSGGFLLLQITNQSTKFQ